MVVQGDIRVPVFDKVDAANQFLIQADYATQSNIATETITVSGYWDTGITDKKPIHAVRIAHTTAGSAGIEQLQPRIPAVGILRGLIVSEPNGFADGNIDTSIQRVKVYDDSQVICELNDLADPVTLASVTDYVTPSPLADLLRPFRAFDFGPAGIDASKGTISLGVDVQDVSDACVFIPVIEITVAGA